MCILFGDWRFEMLWTVKNRLVDGSTESHSQTVKYHENGSSETPPEVVYVCDSDSIYRDASNGQSAIRGWTAED